MTRLQRAIGMPSPRSTAAVRAASRVAIAIATTVFLGFLWWRHLPTTLQSTSNIVGYAAFKDFNYSRSIPMYEFLVFGVPAITVSVYALLAWRGPLRSGPTARRPAREVRLSDSAIVAPASSVRTLPVSIACLLAPALVLTLQASSRSVSTSQQLSAGGILSGLVYLALVALVALAVTTYSRRVARRTMSTKDVLALVNAFGGGSGVLIGLWFVSRHTVIVITSDTNRVRQPWLPLPVALIAATAVIGWGIYRWRRDRNAVAIEYRVLTVVVGSVFVFLLYAQLPSALGTFSGFDDSQALAGASLLSKGYFPWRDLLFIHGLYLDVLRGTFSFHVFGDTRSGAADGDSVILSPLSWVISYLFVVWVARRNGWFIIAFTALLAAGVFDVVDTRFALVPATLVLLGETIRRQSLVWAVLLASVLFVQAILVPETALLAAPTLLTMGLADWVHNRHQDSFGRTWRLSLACVATGLVMSGVFTLFLIAESSLGAFLDYYRIFAPGHVPSGAIPPTGITGRYNLEFGLVVVSVVATFWSVAYRLALRSDWCPQHWASLAAAGFVATYGEKALGRFDVGHVGEVFEVGMPLLILWAWAAVSSAEQYWPGEFVLSKRTLLRCNFPLTVALCAILLLHFGSIPHNVQRVPGRLHALSPSEPAVPYLGYAQPGAVDVALIHDLSAALNHYAGPKGAVFDMTNSLGYVYYLLKRTPGTRFDNISMAVPELAQKLLIGELKRSRPPVVIFNSTSTGLPNWDGLSSNVRHYAVSQYVLAGWAPVLETHGELLLLRKDLLARRPSLPKLSVPAETSDLWFQSQVCDWGYIPNFLSSEPSGASVTLPVTARKAVDILSLTGWAADPVLKGPVSDLVVAIAGRQVGSVTKSGISRPDVAAAISPRAGLSGFSIRAQISETDHPAVFEMGADGLLHQLRVEASDKALSGTITLANGSKAAIGGAGLGSIDSHVSASKSVAEIDLPPGVDVTAYPLATINAPAPLDRVAVAITDSVLAPDHEITAMTLARAGASVGIRVGSCLQWHGYQGKQLFLTQSGGAPITSVTLSGVR